MDLKQYQKATYRAIQQHDTTKDEVVHWTIGLSEEVGEVASHIKHFYYGGEEIRQIDLAMELGDVLWHVAALSTALGIDLNEVLNLNVAKLNHRFPEEHFDFGRSIAREDLTKDFEETEEYKQIKRNIERSK